MANRFGLSLSLLLLNMFSTIIFDETWVDEFHLFMCHHGKNEIILFSQKKSLFNWMMSYDVQ
jgi:hypothetical protein